MEVFNKTMKFIKKNKETIIYAGCAIIGGIIGYKIVKYCNSEIIEAFNAGYNIDDLCYNSALINVVGIEKAAEVSLEKRKIGSAFAEEWNRRNLTPKQFNNMYDVYKKTHYFVKNK